MSEDGRMTDQPETHPYNGTDRRVFGRLRYPDPPEPGTLVGPNGWGETCVVLGTVDGVTLIGRAIVPDMEAARDRVAAGDVRSPLERSGRVLR